ncbi:ABC transporter ATP-binding protein [bacterium]|jgi:putative ABC transport system ATP-binding protein|nr:ABC transporter ATP-binding protein [bacterium]MBT6293209.1 ABC transporter ATP-binding protein [bacterium]
MIKASKIFKTYHNGIIDVPVLKGIDFEMKKGDFIALTGKSGAGKSTLLYQLGLLDEFDSGELFIDGINTHSMTSSEKTQFRLNNLGYVFQDYALLPELSASENIMVPLLMQGVPTKEAYEIAVNTLEKVGLKSKADNLPSQLSGGEQQRVSVARAIANEPKILFADEPTSNLDTFNSKIVLDLFKELNKKGQTILLITHEIEYTKYANKVISMTDGKTNK